ncbi:MAG: metallophosphoesterase [Deltaproteobacteria bacterium]|nr:metallophosphoesterase [Deltaproteobacteria bacterium]
MAIWCQMFVYFGIVLTAGVFLGFIIFLPFSWPVRLILSLTAFLGAARVAVLRAVCGGIGGIEAPKIILFITSFIQGLLVILLLLGLARLLILGLSFLLSFCPGWFGQLFKTFRSLIIGPKASLAILLISAVISGYSLYEAARVPRVREAEVTIPAWPNALDGLTVAILGDMHISRFFDEPWVRKVVDRTMDLKPDLILLPGDMVDGSVEQRKNDVAPLADLKAPFGVLASVGNHEYYSGVKEWLPAFEKLGLKILYNSHVVILPHGAPLIIAGLTDLTALEPRFNLPGPSLEQALAGAPPDVPVVLLEHRPVRARINALNPRIIWQISGHTHGGMLPILKSAVRKVNGGFVVCWYDIEKLKLFVQPGLGLWNGFPMRLFDPSEITFLTVRSA